MTQKRMTLIIPQQHSWLVNLKVKSALIERLLDDVFGPDYSDNSAENAEFQARKYIQAQGLLMEESSKQGKRHDRNHSRRK